MTDVAHGLTAFACLGAVLAIVCWVVGYFRRQPGRWYRDEMAAARVRKAKVIHEFFTVIKPEDEADLDDLCWAIDVLDEVNSDA